MILPRPIIGYVLIALVMSAGSGYLYGCSEADSKAKAAVQKNDADWKDKWEKREEDIAKAAGEAESKARAARDEADARIAQNERKADEERTVADARFRALAQRLRDREAQRDLRPAADAPAPCRDFEADRTRLPESDGLVLAGLAREADDAVRRYNLCIAHVDTLEAFYERVRAKAAAGD